MIKTIAIYICTAICMCFQSGLVFSEDGKSGADKTELIVGLTKREAELLKNRKLEWGLSLSGGGLRSALFQIGVLKGLYDQEKLSEIDIISAVSGGGYAAYWLYGNQFLTSKNENNTVTKFGYYSLDDSVFASSTCDLYKTSNFVGYPRLLYKWATGTPADNYYKESIARTFGKKDVITTNKIDEQPLYLSDLSEGIRSSEIPYLVMNGTVNYVNDDDWLARLYEMTPLHRGNDLMGYSKWDNGRSISFTESALISGAAVEFLLKQKEMPISGSPYDSPLVLHDGGKSENLGAIALIKRGVSNIIVSDAEMDPNYEFAGYFKLKKELEKLGYSFNDVDIAGSPISPEITSKTYSGSNSGFHIIEVKNSGRLVSTLYYIKMQIPKNLMPRDSDMRADMANKGFNITSNILDKLKEDRDKRNSKFMDCSLAQKFFEEESPNRNYEEWILGATLSYKHFLNDSDSVKSRIVRTKLRILNLFSFGGSFFDYEFPHMTTAEQSYYIDQSLALIGLGYAQGTYLLKDISQQKL